MKKRHNYITPPTAEEIIRYRNGEMSPAERHAFEKKLEASAFYRDAEEGLSSLSGEDSASDIKNLRQKLWKQRAIDKKPLWDGPLKIAAGIAVVFIMSWLLIEQLNVPEKLTTVQTPEMPEEEQDLLSFEAPAEQKAQDEAMEALDEEVQEPVAREAEVPEVSEKASEENPEEEVAELDVPDAMQKVPMPEEEIAELSLGIEDDNKDELTESAKIMRAKKSAEDEIKEMEQNVAGAAREAMTMRLEDNSKPLAKKFQMPVINGRVISGEDMMPLPGVNVMVKGSTEGTVSDIDGEFSIKLPDTTSTTLIFSFIGLETTEFEIDGKEFIEVTMSNDMVQLSEVVVTGYGSEQVRNEPVMKRSRPEGGFRSFRKYLKNNLANYRAEDKTVVELHFTVQENGSVGNIRIISSLGAAFEQEVTRLINEFPDWKPATVDGVPIQEEVKIKLRI